MDQDVINLAKAIRQAETGNRPVAGKSGELPSRYQFLPSTWKSWSKQYLGIENAPITLENENKVAYLKIKELKDKGLNPGQIASVWNSGSPDWQGKIGVNKMGVAYDVPKYVNRVYSEYQKIKSTQPVSRLQTPQAPTVEEQRQERVSQGLPVARNPERVEPTLGGTFARDILKTPARLLENVKAIPKALRGESMEEINQGSQSKYFGGRIAPIGTKPVNNVGDFTQNLKESIGAGAEMSSYLPFGSMVTGTAKTLRPLAKMAGKEFIKNAKKRVLGNTLEGTVGTALFEGGKRMTGETDRGNFLENVAYGTAGGIGLGLIGAGLSRGIRQARRTLASLGGKIPEDIATESTQRLKGAWTELNDNYKDLRNFRNKQAKYGRSIEDVLTEEAVVPEIKDGKVDTQKLLPEIDARIQQQAEQITEFAKKFDDIPIPIKDVKDIAEKVIRETPSITATGELKSALSEVARRIDGIQEVYGDTLVPSQLNTIRVQMNQLTKAFSGDVFKQDVADAIADAVREKLDEVIQDDVFRRANAKVGDLINVRKYLQKVDGKQVGGGRFSQAFAGVIGSIVGGEINKGGLPVVGPVLGALGARSVVRGARQYAFGSAGPRTRSILRRIQRKNEIGKEITEKATQRKQLLLPARGETTGSRGFNVETKQTKPINLPSKAQSTIDKQEMANIILQKSKKGDVFNLDGKEFEITRVLEDGVMVVDNVGNKEFISAEDITKAKKIDIQFTEAENEILTEMEISQAGSRVFDNSGIGTEVKAIKSTFPKWVPEDLRSMNLFKSVINKIKENKPIRGSKEQRLYDAIKEEVTNRTIKKGDNLAKTNEVSLAVKANEMSFEDFEKFYNENKSKFKEDVGGDLKKFWETNNFGGEQAFGAVAGLEIDENGELKFNEKNALIGVGGLAVAKKAGLLPKASSVSDDLMKEAKKYKSAEEFVRAQPTVYHGTNNPKLEFKDAVKSNYADERMATFSSSDRQVSEMFGKNIHELTPNLKNPLVVDAKKNNYYDIPVPKELKKDVYPGMKTIDTDSLVEIAQERGHDGVIIKNVIEGAGEFDPSDARDLIVGLKKDSFLTKSQLEEIWKKANQVEKPAIPAKENIVKRLPDLNTNKEISGKDIAGNKFTIKSGEALAVYEMKGNKILVRGEKDITVNKNQFQNLKGQSLVAEAKEFAPELKQVEEKILGGNDPFAGITEKELRQQLIDFDEDPTGMTVAEMKSKLIEINENDMGEYFNKSDGDVKYAQYTLPNGENYREILIKAPENKSERPYIILDKNSLQTKKFANKKLAEEFLSNQKKPENFTLKPVDINNNFFKSSHYPDDENLLAHLRLNDRTYKDKKVTFMEELQSDWAREGRSKGFIKKVEEPKLPEGWRIVSNGDTYQVVDRNGQRVPDKLMGTDFAYGGNREIAIAKAVGDDSFIKAKNGVPNHPLLKNWQELAIKRALKDAVDNDAKYFAWINGDQTSARYNLATYVDEVAWNKSSKTKYDKGISIRPSNKSSSIDIYLDKKGVIQEADKTDWQGKKLDEVLGKGLADKIMADESGTLTGEGLKFGGEWANNLYDKQVKNIVEDLTGAKVKEFDLGLPIDGGKKAQEWTVKIRDGKYDSLNNVKIKQGLEIYDSSVYPTGKHYIITDVLGDGKFKAVPKLDLEMGTKEQIARKTETFDISQKTTKQQGIELTPEVKAIIKGESRPLKKPKNPLPYDVAYAMIPLIFLLFQEKQSTT